MDNKLSDTCSEDSCNSSDLEASLEESAASIERALSNASSLIRAASIVHHLSDEVRQSLRGKSLETLRHGLVPGPSLQPLAALVSAVQQQKEQQEQEPAMQSRAEVESVSGSGTVEEGDQALDQTSIQLEGVEETLEEGSAEEKAVVEKALVHSADEVENRPPVRKGDSEGKKGKRRRQRGCKVAPMDAGGKRSGHSEAQAGRQDGRGKGRKENREGAAKVDPSAVHGLLGRKYPGGQAVFDYRYRDRWTPKVVSPARRGYQRSLLNSLYFGAGHPKIRLNPQKARQMIERKELSAMGLSPCIVVNKCYNPCEEGQINKAVKCLECQVDEEHRVMRTVGKAVKLRRAPRLQDPDTQSVDTDYLFDPDEDYLIEDMLTKTGFKKSLILDKTFSTP